MAETSSPPAGAPAGAPPTKSGAPVRLLVLLGLLLIAIGAWAYDHYIAAPGSEKAYADIQKLVDERNSMGVEKGDLVRSADVRKVVGFGPTWTEKKPDYTIEWYCWWGKIPPLSTWKRYITVVYVGNEPRHFSTHHWNEPPHEEDLPGYKPPPNPNAEKIPPPTTAPMAGSAGPPGGGRGGKGGKGAKGGANAEQGTPPETTPVTPTEGDAPKAADKPKETPKEGDAPKETEPPKAADKPKDAPKEGEAPKAADKPAADK